MNKLLLNFCFVFVIIVASGVIAFPLTPADPISYLIVWIPISILGISLFFVNRSRI